MELLDLAEFLGEDGKLALRPETKSQVDLDRVVALNKSEQVVTRFTTMVNLGIAWDWFEEYAQYLNEYDTWVNWEAVEIPSPDGEPATWSVQPLEPVVPLRWAPVATLDHSRTLRKIQRAKDIKAIVVTVGEYEFDGDEDSQTRMTRAIAIMEVGETLPWTLASNEVVLVDVTTLRSALRLAGLKQAELWSL
jgi:hypothetical protein